MSIQTRQLEKCASTVQLPRTTPKLILTAQIGAQFIMQQRTEHTSWFAISIRRSGSSQWAKCSWVRHCCVGSRICSWTWLVALGESSTQETFRKFTRSETSLWLRKRIKRFRTWKVWGRSSSTLITGVASLNWWFAKRWEKNCLTTTMPGYQSAKWTSSWLENTLMYSFMHVLLDECFKSKADCKQNF